MLRVCAQRIIVVCGVEFVVLRIPIGLGYVVVERPYIVVAFR